MSRGRLRNQSQTAKVDSLHSEETNLTFFLMKAVQFLYCQMQHGRVK